MGRSPSPGPHEPGTGHLHDRGATQGQELLPLALRPRKHVCHRLSREHGYRHRLRSMGKDRHLQRDRRRPRAGGRPYHQGIQQGCPPYRLRGLRIPGQAVEMGRRLRVHARQQPETHEQADRFSQPGLREPGPRFRRVHGKEHRQFPPGAGRIRQAGHGLQRPGGASV